MPNYISTEEGNPIVQRARGKKLKSKKDQLIHQSPEIYGIDQAADWGR
jgi:DNA primase